jgi:GNAT superfamily N-acetyltransferase
MQPMTHTIHRAHFPQDVADVTALWEEYAQTLADYGVWDLGAETIAPDLEALSKGERWDHWRIYLVRVEGRAVAIAGYTPLPHLGEGVAEGRRLYVQPSQRGSGLARALLLHCEAEAVAEGFHTLYLDTFRTPEGQGPLKLYRSLGFEECAPYNDYPPARAHFLVKRIGLPPVQNG